MTQGQSQVIVSEELLSIHEFAKICRTTPRTLRFYEKKGLIQPRKIDEWTKYRYYDPLQARDFLRIKFIQNYNIPLAQVKQALVHNAGEDFLVEELETMKKDIEEKQKEYNFLSGITSFLSGKNIQKYFRPEWVGPFKLLCGRYDNISYDQFYQKRMEFNKKVENLGIKFKDHGLNFYLTNDYEPKGTSVEFAVIVKNAKMVPNLPSNLYFKEYPKTKALVMDYSGPDEYFILVYQRIWEYINKNKINLTDNVFDIYDDGKRGPSRYDNPTKIVFPIGR